MSPGAKKPALTCFSEKKKKADYFQINNETRMEMTVKGPIRIYFWVERDTSHELEEHQCPCNEKNVEQA